MQPPIENDLNPAESDFYLQNMSSPDIEAYAFEGAHKLQQDDFGPHSDIDLLELNSKIKDKSGTHWAIYLAIATAALSMINSTSLASVCAKFLCSRRGDTGGNGETGSNEQ